MSQEDRDRILAKIQKCLNLSKSANEHEAAAALRQAQKMMAAHGLSEEDLAGVGYGCDVVNTPIPARSKLPLFMNTLINLICNAFGVTVVIENHVGDKSSRVQYRMRYWGRKDRVALALYAHAVVFRTVNNAWAAALRENPELATRRNARLNFRLEWLNAVRKTVETFGMPEEERERTELVKVKHYGKELAKTKVNTSARGCHEAASLGRAAADGFSLHRPMNGAAQKRLS